MALRAFRAATTVDEDTVDLVHERTQEMLEALLNQNGLSNDDLVSILFSVTSDVVSVAPAAAVRQLGIVDVPLLCVQEMEVGDSLPLCIRLMLHADSDRSRVDARHVYLHGATVLRPDLASSEPTASGESR